MHQQVQEKYHDVFEYVSNIKQFGGNEQVAEYTARYIHHSIDDTIAKLNLERFATKEDITLLRLETKADMKSLNHRIDLVEQKLNHKLNHNFLFLLFVIIISSVIPDSVKHSIWTLLHL